MAERKGPEGERPGRDPVESGQQEDRSRNAGERNDGTSTEAGAVDRSETGEDTAPRAVNPASTGTEDAEPARFGAAGDVSAGDAAAASAPEATGQVSGSEHTQGADDAVHTSEDNIVSFDRRDRPRPGRSDAEHEMSSDDPPAQDDPLAQDETAGHQIGQDPDVSGDVTAGAAATGDVVATSADTTFTGEAATGEAATGAPFWGSSAEEDSELLDAADLGEPVDLTALRQDDALLDALGGTNPEVPGRSGSGPNLEEMIVSWRRDIDSSPIEELVDVDQAVTALTEAQRPKRRGWFRRRHLVPVATAAAVLMIGCTGVGVAARDALPGDMLWDVAKVFYSDHTRSVKAASSAREELHTAESALDGGRSSTAESALRSAKERMQGVDDEHGLSDLRAAHSSLTARADDDESTTESTTPPQTTTEETPPTSSAETTPPSSEPHPPLPPSSERPTTTPPTTSSDSTTPPTTSSDTSDSSELPSSDQGWESTSPLFGQEQDGGQGAELPSS